jgi:hypothetical protein
MNNASTVAATMTDSQLVAVHRALESDMIAAMSAGVIGNMGHVGACEMLEAIGAEICRRIDAVGRAAFNVQAPPFFDVCHEDGIRMSVAVRVF